MILKPSQNLTKNSLAAHSWFGVAIGALMYLICLSGTLLVFYPQIERWEQPQVFESLSYNPAVVEQAYNDLAGSQLDFTSHMNIALPTKDAPRLVIANEEKGLFLDEAGQVLGEARHDWTHMLAALHMALTLPTSIGVVLVSILGVILCSLIVSGLLAHPKIFKDAFSLRLTKGGNESSQLAQVDIHNRLSVWASPFHLMIALTGAYFGLALPIIGLFAYATEQAPEALVAEVFGTDPNVSHKIERLEIASVLEQMEQLKGSGEVFYLTVHDANTEKQFIEVRVLVPDRLIYSENYRFDTKGVFLGTAGFEGGVAGKQIAYSMYRLHFGHFGGLAIQLFYALLGFALTVISVTGINVWFAKRKCEDWLNLIWPGVVWGAPIAMTVSAVVQLIVVKFTSYLGVGVAVASFWLCLSLCCFVAVKCVDAMAVKTRLLQVWLGSLIVLLLIYGAINGASMFNPAALPVSIILLLVCCYPVLFLTRRVPNR